MTHPKGTALIYAPSGRDAEVAAALLQDIHFSWKICHDLPTFTQSISDDTLFAAITEEATRGADLKPLVEKLQAQPAWSDLPFIFLTRRSGGVEQTPAASRFLQIFGNVTFLERPFHPTTFVSLAQAATRARTRQFEARSRIELILEGERRLQTALVAGRLGSWELDIDARALTMTPHCKTIFGFDADAPITYATLIASIHPDDIGDVLGTIANCLHTGADFATEHRVIWPAGSLHWVESRARVVTEPGQSCRLVGVSSDVTTRRLAEDHLQRVNTTLEERVAARTAELERAHAAVLDQIMQRERTETLLRQSQKLEMIGQLTGGVAHDFNNLLMAVIGNLDMLSRSVPDEPRTARLLRGAIEGAERGAALTQRLLAFARKQDLQVVPTDMVDLVEGMVDLMERSIGPGITLTLNLPDLGARALIDANQVELALLNLVVNARDAMPDGGTITISLDVVSTQSQDRPDTYVRLSVADTGIGMTPEVLEKATEPFFSTKEVGKGTGLGLSMIQGLAVQLGGSLVLTSEVGKGTVAELWLPATQLAETHPTPTFAAAPQLEGRKLRILAVDDDTLILMSTVDMLEDLGHDVVAASSGQKALAELQSHAPFDLMITDFSMPKMTGVELAIQATALRPGLPVLLATGYVELPRGVDITLPRLSKPFFQADLKEAIIKILPA